MRKTLNDTNLDILAKIQVLEWFAFQIWDADPEAGGSKSYDPLTIELNSDGTGIAHSYVFDFHDGGRHHYFDSLDQLEKWLKEELAKILNYDDCL